MATGATIVVRQPSGHKPPPARASGLSGGGGAFMCWKLYPWLLELLLSPFHGSMAFLTNRLQYLQFSYRLRNHVATPVVLRETHAAFKTQQIQPLIAVRHRRSYSDHELQFPCMPAGVCRERGLQSLEGSQTSTICLGNRRPIMAVC